MASWVTPRMKTRMRPEIGLFVLCFCLPAFSTTWTVELRSINQVITGTLSPLSIAVNGKTLVPKKSFAVEALTVSGEIVTGSGDEYQSFYAESAKEVLRITYQEGKAKRSLNVHLPKLASATVSGDRVIFTTATGVKQLLVDDKSVPLKKTTAVYPIRSGAKDKEVHSVRVVGKDGMARLYNLFVTKMAEPPPRQVADAPLAPSAARPGENWTSFRLSLLAFSQAADRNGTGVALAWNPILRVAEETSLGFGLGVGSLKRVWKGFVYLVEGDINLSQGIGDELYLEIGGGFQSWISFGGTRGLAQLGFGWAPEEKWLDLIDRISLGYALLFDTQKVQFARLGFVTSF